MIVVEISNPSDPYTMEHSSELVLALACLLLGSGKYGLDTADGKNICPILAFSGSGAAEAWFKRVHGIDDIGKALEANIVGIAEALESVLIGKFSDRVEVAETLKLLPVEKHVEWLEKRHNQRRSSLNDIGKRAHQYALATRARLASV